MYTCTEDTLKYRIVSSREIIKDNLSIEEADYMLGVLHDQGKTDLVMEEYNPEAKRFGRDPDLH